MNFQSALNAWTRLEFGPSADIDIVTRRRLFLAIYAAVSDLSEHDQRQAMKWAGIPVTQDNVLRIRAMLGYFLGIMENAHLGMGYTINQSTAPTPPTPTPAPSDPILPPVGQATDTLPQ